jgi:transposase
MAKTKISARRRSRLEWRKLVRGWKRSGLTALDFAAASGVAASTLRWWHWKLGLEDSKPSTPLTLVPLRMVEQECVDGGEELAAGSWVLETTRGRLVVPLGRGSEAALLAAVLAIIGGRS